MNDDNEDDKNEDDAIEDNDNEDDDKEDDANEDATLVKGNKGEMLAALAKAKEVTESIIRKDD